MDKLFTKTENIAQDSLKDMGLKAKTLAANVYEDPINNLLYPIGEVLLIILLTFISIKFFDRIINKLFKWNSMSSKKAHTLLNLLKSLSHYAIYFISILTILINIGLNPMPVIAGAGIIGLAIGFGAQSLVRDVITGFFLIFEGQIEVDDWVQINGQINGTVEEIGLRITKIREFNQRLHYIANGMINQVTNYNRERMKAVVSVTVPYEADMNNVFKALSKVVEDTYNNHKENLLQKPEIFGVNKIDQNGINLSVTAMCDPLSYWTVEKEMRKDIILTLNKYNIEFAYPRMVYRTESPKSSR